MRADPRHLITSASASTCAQRAGRPAPRLLFFVVALTLVGACHRGFGCGSSSVGPTQSANAPSFAGAGGVSSGSSFGSAGGGAFGSASAGSQPMADPFFGDFPGDPDPDPASFSGIAVPVCGDDFDGLDSALEQDAGLDACDPDSDDDGCPDAFELYAGGCEDPDAILFDVRCFEPSPPLLREYTLPDDRAAAEVRLRLPRLFVTDGAPREVLLEARPVDATPAGAALPGDRTGGTGSNTLGAPVFTAVQPGAILRFEISVDVRFVPSRVTALRSSAELVADGEVVSTHPIVLLLRNRCPLPE